MTLPRGKTILRRYDQAKLVYPGLTPQEHALQMGMTYKVYKHRVEEELRFQSLRAASIQQAGAITTIDWKLKVGESMWLLLLSDIHIDSLYCNRNLLEEHLDMAAEKSARILKLGDIFDGMQGRHDPRRDYTELRPEYKGADYYDRIVNDAVKFFKPYAQYIDLIADGNHELSILKNAGTDVLARLTSALGVLHGGYGGWVFLNFGKFVKRLKYFHGAGAEAPVTRGVIQTNRQAVYLPDADIVVNGHNHNAYYVPICRERLTDSGEHKLDIQHHIRIPGYMQSYGDGSTGWDVTKGGVPKPIGCAWVQLTMREEDVDIEVTIPVRAPEAHP